MKINEKLIQLRKQHNLSQEDLANQLLITRQSVSLWEKGETVPSLDNLIRLKKLYEISIDEWVSEEIIDTGSSKVSSSTKQIITSNEKTILKSRKINNIFIICMSLLLLAIIITGTINLISRYKELYFLGKNDDTYICQEPIYVINKNSEMVIYDEINKPQIIGTIPNNYNKSDKINGMYINSNNNGDFIQFTSQYEQNVSNVITGFNGYKYLYEIGITSVMDMSRFALSYNLDKVSIFSSRKDIEIASAVRRIRTILFDKDANSANNVNYHIIYGKMNGYVINVDKGVWFITLQDYKNNYGYITIKSPKE